ncbi:MAG TPA: F0F1 ATP synthase subunit gamma, partial [Candidatus Saccharimonadales bacterium]|nr:F0F1 ATP synthase subunit gamma [Candidatus Saccharimonadales bacterium]
MRRPLEIKGEEASMRTIVSLTSAFESLSSMQITKTKGKVLISNQFFNEVWNIYKQIRMDVMFNFGRAVDEKPIDKELLILITAQGGLSGDIDQRLIKKFKQYYNEDKHDIIVIGHHGAGQLEQARIQFKQYFDMPKKDYINVDPIMKEIKRYDKARIFYQDYISLTQQDIKDLDLSEVVSRMGKIADLDTVDDEKITEKTYIFEPNAYTVAMHLETSILRLTLTQFIYDSRLAQLASRFKAMTAAKERSIETANNLHTQYSRAKRAMVDVRLKESLAGLKKIRAG